MAGVKFLKGSEEWQMFMDYWNLCQKFWSIEDNDEYWDNLAMEIDAFAKKYNKDLFAVNIAMAFLNTQDARYKEK